MKYNIIVDESVACAKYAGQPRPILTLIPRVRNFDLHGDVPVNYQTLLISQFSRWLNYYHISVLGKNDANVASVGFNKKAKTCCSYKTDGMSIHIICIRILLQYYI